MKNYIYLALGLSLSFCTAPEVRENKTQAHNTTSQDDDLFFQNQGGQRSVPNKFSANIGYASWYGKELHGRPTASGEIFDMNKMTAAHREYPMGSLVLVKNLENGRKQLVTINDRGPFVEGRIIDVSYAAARELGFAEKGVAKVELELLQEGQNNFMSKAELPPPVDRKNSVRQQILEPEEDFNDSANEDDFFDDEEPVNKKDSRESKFIFLGGQKPKGYTIQIGAFRTRANAERHREEMTARFGKRCYIGQKDGWYFVMIGDFKDSQKAREYLNKLKADGVDVMYRGKIS